MEQLRGIFYHAHATFGQLPAEEQCRQAYSHAAPYEKEMITCIYEHFDAFRLLVISARDTTYAEFLDELVQAEVRSTIRFIETSGSDALTSGRLQPPLLHMISSAYFSGVFEIVIHDMPRLEADRYVESLRLFFTAGWERLLNGAACPSVAGER